MTFPFYPPENTSKPQVLQRLSYYLILKEKCSYRSKGVKNSKAKQKQNYFSASTEQLRELDISALFIVGPSELPKQH